MHSRFAVFQRIVTPTYFFDILGKHGLFLFLFFLFTLFQIPVTYTTFSLSKLYFNWDNVALADFEILFMYNICDCFMLIL